MSSSSTSHHFVFVFLISGCFYLIVDTTSPSLYDTTNSQPSWDGSSRKDTEKTLYVGGDLDKLPSSGESTDSELLVNFDDSINNYFRAKKEHKAKSRIRINYTTSTKDPSDEDDLEHAIEMLDDEMEELAKRIRSTVPMTVDVTLKLPDNVDQAKESPVTRPMSTREHKFTTSKSTLNSIPSKATITTTTEPCNELTASLTTTTTKNVQLSTTSCPLETTSAASTTSIGQNPTSKNVNISISANRIPWTSNRMQVNQVTYGILIGILSVADMILIWTFTYSLVYFEKRSFRILRSDRKHITSNINTKSVSKSPKLAIPTLKPPEPLKENAAPFAKKTARISKS